MTALRRRHRLRPKADRSGASRRSPRCASSAVRNLEPRTFAKLRVRHRTPPSPMNGGFANHTLAAIASGFRRTYSTARFGHVRPISIPMKYAMASGYDAPRAGGCRSRDACRRRTRRCRQFFGDRVDEADGIAQDFGRAFGEARRNIDLIRDRNRASPRSRRGWLRFAGRCDSGFDPLYVLFQRIDGALGNRRNRLRDPRFAHEGEDARDYEQCDGDDECGRPKR